MGAQECSVLDPFSKNSLYRYIINPTKEHNALLKYLKIVFRIDYLRSK